jgi:hypothetical protein
MMGRVLAGISNSIANTKKNQLNAKLYGLRINTSAPQRAQRTELFGKQGCK